jgi:hypothetical protein
MRSAALSGWPAFAAILLALALPAGAGQEAVPSAWADEPVVIDGARADWPGEALASWKKGGVGYAFRNDAETLYVLFVIEDPKFRSSIEANGITLYFGAKGARSKDYGIRFKKVRLTPDEYIAVLEKRGPVPEEQKAALRAKAGFQLFHHEVLDRKGKPVQEPAGGTAARPAVFKYAQGERGSLVYEFAIPLGRGSDLVAGAGADAGTVMVGFAWGGETEAMRKAAAKRLREQANVSNEEIEGGERPIVGSVSSGPAPKKYDIWTGVKLAPIPQ